MRHRMISAALLSAILLLIFLPPAFRSEAQISGDGRPDQVVLQPGPSLAGVGDYLSPPTAAARPFTHMLLRREAGMPEGAELALFVRASTDGATWSDWHHVEENDDLWTEADGPEVEWSQTIEAGALASFWQVRGQFTPAPDGRLPELRRIEVNTVDVSDPPAPRQAGLAAAPLAKPAVVSRTAWGSPDGQASRVPPSYYPVKHLVVHHTADSNTLLPSEPNWAARVRAEWSFHTHTRGWGDVGYNYLIDPNGAIYEGRAGGDDAVAFHDTANYGSMGVVLIGTYATVPPTAAAQNALVSLLAWKASQKRIDPLGSSYYYGCAISRYCAPFNPGAIVPNIAGHRQVTPGHTTCAGDQTMALLPGIRNRVKQALIGGPGDDGDLQIDELESSFARSNAFWYDAACGAGGHTYYTYTTDNPAESTNSATWRPNIPTRGTYRVYARIPQGCGLAPPPYASTMATYRIHHADGDSQVTIDHNSPEAWANLGLYTFEAGTGGAVELYDLTGEPYANRRLLFFDALKWVPESAATGIELTSVTFDRTALASGELLKVSFTVRNTGATIVRGQAPRVDMTTVGELNTLENSYVYDQDECFVGNSSGSYPAFAKESDRFRLVLGSPGWDGLHTSTCTGATSDYPWRWGLNADLAPGQEQTVAGFIRFRDPGVYQLQAGLIQEYVKYYAEGLAPTTITVTPERIIPDAAAYDPLLRPEARVYQLGEMPDNFLARTANPLSIPRGDYIGSFAWDGSLLDWGAGGPLGLADQFLVEQTRAFLAPTDGVYTFRTTTDDGSWLWVDGQQVVTNHGLHAAGERTGEIALSAGVHVVAFKYFERTGQAAAEYSMRLPGGDRFGGLPDPADTGTLRFGSTFITPPDIAVAADDQGGTGIGRIVWSLNGTPMPDAPGALLHTGRLQAGDYRLSYTPIDQVGNQGETRELAFSVNPNLTIRRTYLPIGLR